MSEQRRSKLMGIQKREQLKGLLSNKFKLRYGTEAMPWINNEVGKFLNNERLTEENLRKLDDKIGKEAQLREKKQDALSEHRSVKSGSRPRTTASGAASRKSAALQHAGQRAAEGGMDDAISVKSYASSRMSGASNLSRKSGASARPKKGVAPDAKSLQSDLDTVSQASRPMSQYSKLNEEDEWTAIMNFNTVLHYEEQKQAMLREQERKRLVKDELDRQVRAKKLRNRNEVEEDRLYDDLQRQHLDLLAEKEAERQGELQAKIDRERCSRDAQLREEKRRKKLNLREEMAQEQAIVAKLQDEMGQERQMLAEKRRQEKAYLQRMLAENADRKEAAAVDAREQQAADVQAQDAYARMLLQQEKDREDECARREARAQEFMGKMADGVLRHMDEKNRDEDLKIRQFEMDKEQQDRLNDQMQYQKMKDDQRRMRDDLSNQMNDKKHRERMDKEFNDEQAKMWALDRQNYQQQEDTLNCKIKNRNNENRHFLESQMQEREQAKRNRMNYNEHLLNKQLLHDINATRKEPEEGEVRGGSALAA